MPCEIDYSKVDIPPKRGIPTCPCVHFVGIDTDYHLKVLTELSRVIGKESEPGARRYGKLKRCG